MPEGLPKASELWEGELSFFSIDTDLIQSAGYNFAAGALHQLPLKLPVAMQLHLTEVVVQEVVKHQMEPVQKAFDQVTSAIRDIERITAVEVGKIRSEVEKVEVLSSTSQHFRKLVEDYAQRCRGGILPLSGDRLAASIFERYFKGDAPFGIKKDKKAEFPDAASLVILEEYAKSNKTMGIIASRDSGSSDFAANSNYLYCVKSIEDLAELFVATDEHAMVIKARIDAALLEEESLLRYSIKLEIEKHVSDSDWIVGELYSGSVSSVEGEVYDYELDEYDIHINEAEIWQSEDEPGVWIVDLEITAHVNATIDVSFNAWDSIDREEVSIGSNSFSVPTQIEFKIYIAFSGISENNDPEEWEIIMDTARGNYSVDVGEVDPDFSDDSYEH